MRQRVLVVGAGFAGLACADRLAQLGHDVTVFEARERVDGRAWSQHLLPDRHGIVVERHAGPDDADLVRQPVGRVHTAGEHTAGEWIGLMEGALRSGVRAAEEVHAAN